MTYNFLLAGALVSPLLASAIRIGTYNLRFDALPDNVTVQDSISKLADPLQQPVFFNTTGEQPWSTRRVRIAEQLLSEDVAVVGFQEVLIRQLHDMEELLGDDWAWVGYGVPSALLIAAQQTFPQRKILM
ncbi:hypothetical protein HGRIS_012512 [Hohenbuehelia grisea]|uniref:Endonuclease/exonuclease/phosphatase domain-containing protein n=1 Tax=Hohenbuehelia grisea TaxID=104357 RepID=A0ABR3ISJ3_9AGAR